MLQNKRYVTHVHYVRASDVSDKHEEVRARHEEACVSCMALL